MIVDIAATRGVLSFRRPLARNGAYMLVARGLFGFIQAAIVGLFFSLFSSKRMGVFNWKPSDAGDLQRLGGMLEAGALRPIVDRRIGLDEIAKGLDAVHRHEARGKIIVTMS